MSYSFDQSLSHQSVKSFFQPTQRNYPIQPYAPPQNKNQKELHYHNFFGPILEDIQKSKAQNITKEALERHKIRILDQNDIFYGKMINYGGAYVQNSTSKFYGLQSRYDVVIGNFYLIIHVLNLHRNAEIGENFQANIGKGSFGVVKFANVQNKKIAVKRIFFNDFKRDDVSIQFIYDSKDRCDPNEIRQAVKQYCIYKICSMLKIGPQLIFEDVYDLVCYNDGIEFQMELCQRVEGQIRNTYENDIKHCVAMLHSFKFIHKDLKPLNTLFSPSLGKYVISDFGITHSVKQQINEKTQTYFQGSFHYVSPEMKQIFDKKKTGLVNLYQNDIHCLIQTFKEVKNASIQVDVNQFSRNSMSMNQYADQNEYESGNYNSNNYESGNNSNNYHNNNYNSYGDNYGQQHYDHDHNTKGNKYLQSEAKQNEQQVAFPSMKKTNMNKQSAISRQSKKSKQTFESQTKDKVNAQNVEKISRDYQDSFLPANFPAQDLIKNSIEINFYQARVIYQILKQESQKKQMSQILYMFSDINAKDLKQNINKDQVSKLIKQKVNQICNHEQKTMIVEIVFLFVQNLLHHDKTYYRSIMLTRNTIRTYGIHSQEVVEKLKDILTRREIPNFNYAQLNANITILEKYKQSLTEKKIDTYCADLGTHDRLYNRKTMDKFVLQILKSSNMLKEQMSIRKRKNVLIGCLEFMLNNVNININLLLEIKKCILQLFNPSKWKNQQLEQALFIDERNLKGYNNHLQLKSQILQIMYKGLQQENQLSIHFLETFSKIYCHLQPAGAGSCFLFLQIKKLWDELQVKSFDQIQNNEKQQQIVRKQKQKYLQTLYYYVGSLFRFDFYRDIAKLGKQTMPIIQKYPPSLFKIMIFNGIARASYLLKDLEFAQKCNEECYEMRKIVFFPKVTGIEFCAYYQFKAYQQIQRKQYRQAIQTLQKQLSIASASINEQDLFETTIDVCRKQSLCFEHLQQYEKAIDLQQKALRYTFVFARYPVQTKTHIFINLIKFNMILGRKQNLPKLFDQFIALRAKCIYQTKNQALFKKYHKKNAIFNFSQQEDFGTDQMIVYAKKVALASVDPYLPVFLWYYRKYCEQIAEYYINLQMSSKALPYLWKYFKVHPHEQILYDEFFYKKVDCFGALLIKAHCSRRAIKFLQGYVYKIPLSLVNCRSEIFKKLSSLSRDFSENIYPFYNIVWKNKGYRNEENKECCQKQLQLVQNKLLRKIYLKKLALIQVTNSDQNQIPQQKMIPFNQFEIDKDFYNRCIQDQIKSIEKIVQQCGQIKSSILDTQGSSEILELAQSSMYQTQQFKNLIRKKKKQIGNKA